MIINILGIIFSETKAKKQLCTEIGAASAIPR
jgi:hypothetical protein